MISIDHEKPSDQQAIEALLDAAFGPDRVNKSSSLLRQGLSPVAALSFVARQKPRLSDASLMATIRFWEVAVRDMLSGTYYNTLLLGPLAVHPDAQGMNLGSAMMEHALSTVDAMGYKRVILVGDIGFYSRFGFETARPRTISMPGGLDADRLLVRQRASVPTLPAVGQVVAPQTHVPAFAA